MKSPWSKKEICINVVFMAALILFGSILLFLKNIWLLLAYWGLWGVVIIVGRGLACRHCDLLGKACPTWGFGIIGGLLYSRSDKKDFTEIRIWKFYLDVVFIAIAMLFPVFVYLSFLFIGQNFIFNLMGALIYLILGLLTFIVHSYSCKKCPIPGCPLRRI